MAWADATRIEGRKVPPPFERTLKVVMSPETHPEVEGFTLLFSTLAPRGGCTDLHAHETSGELMVVTRGNGKAWLAGEELELRAGVALYAPKGVEHRTMNTGDETMELVCVFVPSAPADYVREMIEAAGSKGEG